MLDTNFSITQCLRAGNVATSLSKIFFGQNWLDLGNFSWIWAKFEQIKIKFGQK